MPDLVSTVRETVRRYCMISTRDTVLAAVSGGPDSVCMLHVMLGLREEMQFDIVVAHLDHQFRGEESRRDAEFVAQYLQLRHANEHPQVLATNTRTALERLAAAGLLDGSHAAELIEALTLWLAVQSRLRLAFATVPQAGIGDEPKALRLALSGIGGLEFDPLVDKMQRMGARAHQIYVDLVEKPAAFAGHRNADDG